MNPYRHRFFIQIAVVILMVTIFTPQVTEEVSADRVSNGLKTSTTAFESPQEELREALNELETIQDELHGTILNSDNKKLQAELERGDKIFAKSNPAVVSVVGFKEVLIPSEDGDSKTSASKIEYTPILNGTGFFVSKDGKIVTNHHVVEDIEGTYHIFTSDGREYTTRVVDTDPVLDIAILEVVDAEGVEFPKLDLSNPDLAKIGQRVVSISSNFDGSNNSFSAGLVEDLSISINVPNSFGQTSTIENVIQTNTELEFGGSGGPLLNSEGEVVGMNVAFAETKESMSFAVSSKEIINVLNSIDEHGIIVRPFLGVHHIQINHFLSSALELSVDHGTLVIKEGSAPAVLPRSPADKAGITEGDVILRVNGKKITKQNPLANDIRKREVGEVVSLEVLRGGSRFTVEVELVQAHKPKEALSLIYTKRNNKDSIDQPLVMTSR